MIAVLRGACLLHKFLTAIVIIHIYTTALRRPAPPSVLPSLPLLLSNDSLLCPLRCYTATRCAATHAVLFFTHAVPLRMPHTCLAFAAQHTWLDVVCVERVMHV